ARAEAARAFLMIYPDKMDGGVCFPGLEGGEDFGAHRRVEGMQSGRTSERDPADVASNLDAYICAHAVFLRSQFQMTGICSIKSMALDRALLGYVIIWICHSLNGPTFTRDARPFPM